MEYNFYPINDDDEVDDGEQPECVCLFFDLSKIIDCWNHICQFDAIDSSNIKQMQQNYCYNYVDFSRYFYVHL